MQDTFHPKLSMYLFMYLALVHVFASICIIASMSGRHLYFLLLLLLIVSVIYICNAVGLLCNRAVYALTYLKDRQWLLSLANGDVCEMTLQGKSVLTRFLMILHFHDKKTKRKQVVMLFPDSLSQSKLKLLRRYVRLGYL